MQAIDYSACCAFDLRKSFSHQKRSVDQQDASLFSDVSSPLSNDFHGPFCEQFTTVTLV